MRHAFSTALLRAAARPEFVFLTGDLGFRALEELRTAMRERFINAGIAEQNMISVAAGLARSGLRPWVYSIAPFVYARPLEQIRNDLCLHRLPAVLVGNGGGYGYGAQGATHHALEDYGLLTTLQGMTAYIPGFDQDLPMVCEQLFERTIGPAYLRLGISEQPKGFEPPAFAPWRSIITGDAPVTVVAVGPLIGGLIQPLSCLPRRPSLWALSQLPADNLPDQLIADLARTRHLLVAEEHVARGGAGEWLARNMLCRGLHVRRFTHQHALGYPSGLYGSQAFHRKECGLDAISIVAKIAKDCQA